MKNFFENPDLLLEKMRIGQINAVVCFVKTLKPYFPKAFGSALIKENVIIWRIITFVNFGKFNGIEEIIGHELDYQGHISFSGLIAFTISPFFQSF